MNWITTEFMLLGIALFACIAIPAGIIWFLSLQDKWEKYNERD